MGTVKINVPKKLLNEKAAKNFINKTSTVSSVSTTVQAPTPPATPVGSSTAGSSTAGSSTAGSSTAGSSTVGSSTVGSSTAGSSTVGSSILGSSILGSSTVALTQPPTLPPTVAPPTVAPSTAAPTPTPTPVPTPTPTAAPTPSPTEVDCSKFSLWKKWKCIAKKKFRKAKRFAKKKMNGLFGKSFISFVSSRVQYCSGLSELEKWSCVSNLFGVDQKELIMLHLQSGSKCSEFVELEHWKCLAESAKLNENLLEDSAERLFLEQLNIDELKLFASQNSELVAMVCPPHFNIARLKWLARLSRDQVKSGKTKVYLTNKITSLTKTKETKETKEKQAAKKNNFLKKSFRKHLLNGTFLKSAKKVINRTATKFKMMNRTIGQYKFSKSFRKGNWQRLVPAMN